MTIALVPEQRSAADLDSDLLELFRELGDLKRTRSAGRAGSIAERLFADAWGALCAGDDVEAVAMQTTARALAAARLGDLDHAKLVELGLTDDQTAAVLRRGLADVSAAIHPPLRDRLDVALGLPPPPDASVPRFVGLLAEQPRAGVTCPGKPRLMLQPAENHAEHCLIVAVYAVLASPAFGADPAFAFLAGMAHHLHSAAMPDAGFTGEMLLGGHLGPVIARARAVALAEVPARLQPSIEQALASIADDASPEARAFHAADVIDRVLEIEQHLRAATATMATVLDDYALVHAGPVKPFHDAVLSQVGLLP